MKTKFPLITFILCAFIVNAQENQPKQDLDTIVIASTRIDLPFKENSRTINIISSEAIKNSAANNIADLLQQVAVKSGKTYNFSADVYHTEGKIKARLYVDGYQGYSNQAQTNQ